MYATIDWMYVTIDWMYVFAFSDPSDRICWSKAEIAFLGRR